MNCLKCGRSVNDGGVFCGKCLEIMAKHPVKQGTSLQLPRSRSDELAKKQTRRKPQIKPEEKIRKQKEQIRRLTLATAILSVLVALLLCWLGYEVYQKATDRRNLPGKNYTVETEET